MNSFVYTAETAYDKKKKIKKKQKCLTRYVQVVCSYMTSHRIYKHIVIGEKSYFSTNSIHNNTCHETIWWPLQVNGPPVNVPATLDQIIEILPHMSSELQLHTVKLKCKLEYKSHYMYDMICSDLCH